jgi:hypothetical protein
MWKEAWNERGSLVTIDAMGCQTEIAKKIVDAKAVYCLAVKGNQPTHEPARHSRRTGRRTRSIRQRGGGRKALHHVMYDRNGYPSNQNCGNGGADRNAVDEQCVRYNIAGNR